jgi:erythronate-4-phosphate dehydrogenase
MARLIIVDKNTPLAEEAFGTLGDVLALETSEFTPARVREADALIVRSETKVGRTLLDGSRVQFVGTVTIGTDHIDTGYLAERGIGFASAPGCNANSVKEYVVAALLVLAARRGTPLRGRTLGIVGVGHIGSLVAEAARALGMDVLLNDPPLERQGVPGLLPLDGLMDADFLTIHVPLTRTGSDATYHLFDERRIAALKKGSVLLNTSRGAVADNAALKKSLKTGHTGGSVLDVWEGEPSLDTELLQIVDIGTPHIAGYSFDGKTRAVEMVYKSFCHHAGVEPRWKLSAEKLPPPGTPELRLDSSAHDEVHVMNSIVSGAFDISSDDVNLRRILPLPSERRSSAFQSLRSGYRVRREFAAFSVVGENRNLLGALTKLGFLTILSN